MKKNSKAFGIVEVMVAVGVMGIIAIGLTSMMTTAMKQQKGVQAKDQQREVTAEVRNLLSNKTACLNSFNNSNVVAGFTKASILDSVGVAKYTVGTNDKTGMLTFIEIRVNNWVPDPSAPATQGTADLVIKLQKVGDTGTVKDVRPDVITLKIIKNAANLITQCFSIGSGGDSLWDVSPTNFNDIHYSGGNVGIGTNNPTAALDVVGTGKVSGVLSSGKVQVVDVVVINTACTSNGLVARDAVGVLLSCQSGTWKSATGGGTSFYNSGNGAYRVTSGGFGFGSPCAKKNPITNACSCPAGSVAVIVASAPTSVSPVAPGTSTTYSCE